MTGRPPVCLIGQLLYRSSRSFHEAFKPCHSPAANKKACLPQRGKQAQVCVMFDATIQMDLRGLLFRLQNFLMAKNLGNGFCLIRETAGVKFPRLPLGFATRDLGQPLMLGSQFEFDLPLEFQ